jgi:hypothetical protein
VLTCKKTVTSRRWLAVALLAVAVLAPYHRVITGRAIPIPDDIFVSDLADGEFPARVEAGRILRGGESPVWTTQAMTGMPLMIDPLSTALFTALPPAQALGTLLGLLLLAAAFGTYALARQLGASRPGAFLAGFAFAWSGFFVCQLRHLGIIGTVAFFPWALVCLERASVVGLPARRRLLWLTAFGGFFGLQLLAGFPQSAYISALFYAALVAFRAGLLVKGGHNDLPLPWRERIAPAAVLALGALAAVALGALVGMAALLPMGELGGISDRSGGGTYAWATQFKYAALNFLTFFVPYINGDISDMTYTQPGIFWEDYGYVGLVTVLTAMAAVWVLGEWLSKARLGRRGWAVVFWTVAGLTAYLLVLGPKTPLYRIAYECLPGLKTFRFPTRFLFVAELSLALLGGLGLTFLQAAAARREPHGRRAFVFALVGVALACITVGDLVWNNFRQNPLADSGRWLAPPATVPIIRASPGEGRVYAPTAKQQHTAAFCEARGWSGDLTPYYLHRDFLQPDSNLLHGLPTVNAYAGISASWAVDLIGDHNRQGFIETLYDVQADGLRANPAFYDWLEALSVRWLLLPVSVIDTWRVECVGQTPAVFVYRLKDTLPRVRFAPGIRLVSGFDELKRLSVDGRFDPREEVALYGASDFRSIQAAGAGLPGEPGEARIIVDRANEVAVEARSERGGLLVLADTYYPGWTATVDGVACPILRVNVMQRGVAVPPGVHRVTFAYRSRAVRTGLALTGLGVALLLAAAAWLAGYRREEVKN